MSVKSILKAYWSATEGECNIISCRKVKDAGEKIYYRIETDGNIFEAMVYKDDEYTVFYREEGVVGSWCSTDGEDVIVIDDCPYHLDGLFLSRPSEIAKAAGVSVATVYNRAKELGRFPTVEEARTRKSGRPRKYF